MVALIGALINALTRVGCLESTVHPSFLMINHRSIVSIPTHASDPKARSENGGRDHSHALWSAADLEERSERIRTRTASSAVVQKHQLNVSQFFHRLAPGHVITPIISLVGFFHQQAAAATVISYWSNHF